MSLIERLKSSGSSFIDNLRSNEQEIRLRNQQNPFRLGGAIPNDKRKSMAGGKTDIQSENNRAY